jgi:hypothetical protein
MTNDRSKKQASAIGCHFQPLPLSHGIGLHPIHLRLFFSRGCPKSRVLPLIKVIAYHKSLKKSIILRRKPGINRYFFFE